MGTSPSSLPRPALSLGRYAIRRKLGSGSAGAVYLAHDSQSRSLVALKLLRPDRISREAVDRLKKEFRVIASLRHPQIAAAYDFGYTEDGALPFYTREYIPGEPLGPGAPGGAPPWQVIAPILDLLDALEYLHAHGFLHLDIHPGNRRGSKPGDPVSNHAFFLGGGGGPSPASAATRGLPRLGA